MCPVLPWLQQDDGIQGVTNLLYAESIATNIQGCIMLTLRIYICQAQCTCQGLGDWELTRDGGLDPEEGHEGRGWNARISQASLADLSLHGYLLY